MTIFILLEKLVAALRIIIIIYHMAGRHQNNPLLQNRILFK